MSGFRFPLVALLLVALLAGCESLSYKPKASGKEGEIVVVIDSTNWKGPLGDALREELGPWIATLPAPEPLFDLRQTNLPNPSVFETLQKMKNVVFAAPLGEDTPESRFMRTRVDSAAAQSVLEGRSIAISRRDMWREDQQIYYVLGATAEDVAAALRESGEDMRYAFNEVTRRRMTLSMFDRGRQPDMEQSILDRHGFTVNVQHDYFTAMDTTNFVWLRRVVSSDSWRSVFVWYTDQASPADLTPEWIVGVRDRLTRAYVNGNMGDYVMVDQRRPLESENINFLDRFGYEVRGLWHMVGDGPDGSLISAGMGGPFVTYAFYDQESGRTYLIDGMVFAPGFEKRDFLRQMEVIAYTFRTTNDVARQSEPVVAAVAK